MHLTLSRPRSRSHRGYTLIELVATFVVLSILAGIGLVTYSRVITKSQDESARLTLHSLMREASILAAQQADGFPVTLPNVQTAASDTKTAATTVVVTQGVSAASAFKVLDGLPSTGYGVVSFQAGGPSDPVGAVGSAMLSLAGHCVLARIPQLGAAVQSWVKDVDASHCDGSFALLGPDAPDPHTPPRKGGILDLTATAGDGMVTLDWPNMSGATGYKVLRDGVQKLVVGGTHYVDYVPNGTQYSYQVIAFDGSGDLAKSRTVTALPLPPVPAMPVNVTGTAGDQVNSLSWDPVLRAESYLIYRDGLLLTQVNAPATSYADNYYPLTNGRTYTYQIVAVNMGGQSAPSQPISLTPMPPMPAIPTGLAATPYDGAAVISWAPAAHATAYRLFRDGSFIGQVGGTSWSDRGLTNGQTYTYRVIALNVAGQSAASGPVEVTPQPGTVLPSEPAPGGDPYGLTGTPADTSASLRWNAIPGADGYHLYRDGQLLAPAPGTSYTDLGLVPGTTYQYSVASFTTRGGEAAQSPELHLTTTINGQAPTMCTGLSCGLPLPDPNPAPEPGPTYPAVPSGLQGTPGDGQVTLTWDVSSNATTYAVFQDGSWIGSVSGTRMVVGNLTNGTTYGFQVQAGNPAVGWSAQSNEVRVTPRAPLPGLPAPTGVTAVGGLRQITVSWQPVDGATGYRIYVQQDAHGGLQLFKPVSGTTTTVLTAPDSADWLVGVTAYNTNGESPMSSLVETLTVPATPSDVTATAGVYQVTVSWSAVGTAATYTVTGPSTVTVTAPATSTTFTNLNAGKLYTFTVTATNATGTSAPSAEVSATPLSNAPANLTATAGDSQVSLSWDAISRTSGYRIYRGGQLLTQVTGTSYVDSGLTNGTTYTYQVSAELASGESARSNSASATPLPPVPATPTGLTVTSVSTNVSLRWNATANVEHYTLYRDGLVVTSPAAGTTTFVDTPPAGRTVYYRISASNLAGESAQSASVGATTVPGTPANFAAVLYNNAVGLSWDAVPGAPSYTVRRADLATPVYVGSATAATDANVTLGSSYTYSIVATNTTGDSPAASLPVTLPPPAPADFTAASGDKVVHLKWTAAPGATGYRLMRDGLVVNPNITATSFDDTAVTNGTSYTYKIVAYNVAGTSADSAPATVTPQIQPPAAPTGLKATSGNGTVALSWSTVGGTVDGYRITRDGQVLTQVTPATTTSYTDTVAAGPNHTYTVAAYNAGGYSAEATSVVAAAGGAPLAPANLTATAGSNTVTLTWTATGGPGVAPTSYQIYRGSTLVTQVNAPTTSYADGGLPSSTAYTYQVAAVNTYGTSPAASASATTTMSAYANAVIGDGASGYWRLNESSGTTAYDSSGKGLNGTYNQGTPKFGIAGATGDSDPAVYFPAGTRVSIPHTTLTGNYSLEAWLYTNNSNAFLVGSGYTVLGANNGQVLAVVGGVTLTSPTTPIGDGQWHHAVVTVSPSTATLYVDGAAVTSATPTASSTSIDYLGWRNSTSGQVDDLAIYPTTLTATQVTNHWHSAGRTPPAPANVTATPDASSVALNWSPSADTTATAYRVYRGGTLLLAEVAAPAHSYTDYTAATNTAYSYTVAAVSSNGEGPQSAPINVRTASTLASAYATAVRGDGASGYWRLNESSGTTAYDSSGKGLNGTYNQGTPKFGIAGATGDSDPAVYVPAHTRVSIPRATLSGNYSLEAWVYTKSSNAFLVGASTVLGANNGQVLAVVGGVTLTSPTTPIGDGQWHHVVVTVSPSAATLYVDGAAVASGTPTASSTSIENLGWWDVADTQVDDLAIYPTTLTVTQVANHWHAAGH